MARALLSSPLSACFFPDSSSSASVPQLAAALCAVDSDIAISRSVEERKVYTQNFVKYNWGKMLQDKRLLLRCTGTLRN